MTHSYFATCARGLEPMLTRELVALGACAEPGRGGVAFRGTADLLYRANLWLRTAVRVLRPIHEATVRSPDELYAACRSINWAEYLTADHTLAVDCNVRDSAITHSQYAARRVKDAICDQFRDKLGRRPSVDPDQPGVGLNLHIYRNHMILSLDSSWHSLHKRGYRPVQTRAPLNEALAAGLLLHAGYDGSGPLVDWMCGGGTFCIEAAWIALNRPPGLTRKWFGFMGWPDFDRPLWNAIREEARRAMHTRRHPIVGTDVRRDAIAMATSNAKAAGIAHVIHFEPRDLTQLTPPEGPPGIIICNPPYGERLGEEREWVGLHRAMGASLARWPGWRLLVFTASDWLAQQIGRPVVRQTPFYNGRLACKLWELA